MVTLYDLLEIDEKSSKNEIEKAYQELALEYATNTNVSKEENQENEMILNKLKMAYEILIDDEKRKKYDNSLAKKRAEDLIKNVTVEPQKEEKEEIQAEEKLPPKQEEVVPEENNQVKYNVVKQNNEPNEEENLTKEEQKKVRKAAQKEFNANLKKAQKAEQEYNQAYNEAYNKYLRKMGYDVKEPWTWKRIKNVIIFILSIIIVCTLAWAIPPVKAILIGIYEENFIVKALVDIVRMIINGIVSIFK